MVSSPLRRRSGFLFCASEFGNHGFYQFQGVGEDDDSPMCSSLTFEAGDETVVELEPRHAFTVAHVYARICMGRRGST